MDLGKAFAQVNTAADGLSQDQKKKMFTGLNEYMMTMGLSPEQQKGTYVAMYQMFSKGRILQEEVNQLSERGFSQKVFQEAAMKAQGIKSREEYQKMQQAGKIDPTKVFPVYAEMLQKMVHETGAHSTDVEEAEPVEHLCGKCEAYACEWMKTADKLWEEHPYHQKGYTNFKKK